MRVLIHYDEDGLFTVHTDQPATVIVADDRAPDDWAYELGNSISVGTVDETLRGASIGSADDNKHEEAQMKLLYGKPDKVN